MSNIRTARTADASCIAQIVNALLRTTTIEWRYELYSSEEMLAWMKAHDCVVVAEDGGEVVGFGAYGPFRDSKKWPGYRFTVENTIHVREDHWRAGVGRALMEVLINQAAAAGMHSMIAAVDDANTPSIRLHETLGFAEVARMPQVGAKFGRWLDLVFLELILDDRAGPGED